MPWPSNDDYFSFKEEMIENHAPAVSGVYGIYNLKHHILISHSNNIRESLLRHHKETNFRYKQLEPAGFTFEPCPPEARELRMRQLTSEYQPVLRPGEPVGWAALWRSWTTSSAGAVRPQGGASRSSADVPDRRSNTTTATRRNHGGDDHASRDQVALLGTGSALIIVAVALFVLLGENRSFTEIWSKRVLSIARNFAAVAEQSSSATAPAGPPGNTVAEDGRLARAGRRGPAIDARAEAQNGGKPAADFAGTANQPAIPPAASKSVEANPATPPNQEVPANLEGAAGERKYRPWTVQALSTTDKGDAASWLDRLRSKGYDAFIVETEIKGLRWYRVRVGNFTRFHEAEALEKVLRSKEGFPDAFVAPNAKTDVALASRR